MKEPFIQRTNYKLEGILGFSTAWKVGAPNLRVVQGSPVHPSKSLGSKTLVSFLTSFLHILHPLSGNFVQYLCYHFICAV